MPPTANAGAPPATITFASLPAAVPLDGSASTASAGSIITWAWEIKSKPPGSTAALSASNVVNPTLNNVDLPGTYLVVLNVQQTDLTWAWDSDPASGGYENTPNTDPTARIYISAAQEFTGLVPPALGERTMSALTPGAAGYTSAWQKWLNLWAKVDTIQDEIDTLSTTPSFDDIYVDNIYEKTAAHTIVMKDDVTAEGSIAIDPGETLTTNNINTPVSGDLLITAGDDLTLVATDVLGMGAGGAVTLTAGAGQSVTIAGGVGFPDVKTDVIAEATAAAGVTVDSVLLKDGEVRTTRVYTEAVTSLTVEAFDELTLGAVSTISMITSANVIVDATSTITVTADGLVSVDAGEGAITLDAQDSITIATSSGGAGTNDITITAAGDTRVQHAVFTGTTAATSALALSAITADDSGTVGIALNGVGDIITIDAARVTLTASATFEADNINEFSSGVGVKIEGIRLENEGSNVYAFDVGNATSTLNITGNTDATTPYALTTNHYGDLSAYGKLSGGAGTSGSLGTADLCMDAAYVNQATTGTAEETLYTYNLPASSFVVDGASLRIYSLWRTAANGNTKVPRTKINGTEIAGASVATNNGKLVIEAQLIRTGTDAQLWESDTMANGGNANSRVPTASAFDDGAAMAITFTGTTATASGDLTLVSVRILLAQE